jgi:hypothetical protein
VEDQKEILKSMLKNVIAGNEQEAADELQTYLLVKSRETLGVEAESQQASAD